MFQQRYQQQTVYIDEREKKWMDNRNGWPLKKVNLSAIEFIEFNHIFLSVYCHTRTFGLKIISIFVDNSVNSHAHNSFTK